MPKFNLKSISDLDDIKNKKVIVRGSFNVPIDQETFQVIDPYRLENTLETVEYLRGKGAKIILIGHIGRNKEDTLKPIARYLQSKMPVIFIEDIFDDNLQKTIDSIGPGGIVLLENLRQHDGEENNDEDFSKHLSSLGDYYVNEAFPVSHRDHASLIGVPKFLPSFAGINFYKEVKTLSKAFDPDHPFTFILGGAKVATKMPLIKNFIGKADDLFIGGVLANDFFESMGYEIGKSVTSEDEVPKELLEEKTITLPEDIIVDRNGEKLNVKPTEVTKDDSIFDSGEQATIKLTQKIMQSEFIVWNGPLGYCEEGYVDGTNAVVKALIESDAQSIVGGGDTLAAVPDDLQRQLPFVSAGGGAMLTFLGTGSLPAIEALNQD